MFLGIVATYFLIFIVVVAVIYYIKKNKNNVILWFNISTLRVLFQTPNIIYVILCFSFVFNVMAICMAFNGLDTSMPNEKSLKVLELLSNIKPGESIIISTPEADFDVIVSTIKRD